MEAVNGLDKAVIITNYDFIFNVFIIGHESILHYFFFQKKIINGSARNIIDMVIVII